MSPLFIILKEAVRELELYVQALGDNFQKPNLVDHDGVLYFRHEEYDDLLASHLKCIRIVSSLNASLSLLEIGYVQEVYVLCRCIDEFIEDILYMATPLNGNSPSKEQIRFITEFYQEEYDQPLNPLMSAQRRSRVPRKKIQAAISRIKGQDLNPSDSQKVHRTISQTLSGYVHGAYVHIMELYGGNPPYYHTSGMLNSPKILECEKNLVHHIYRSIKASQIIARRVQAISIDTRLVALSKQFEKQTGCVSNQNIEEHVKRLKKEGVKKFIKKP